MSLQDFRRIALAHNLLVQDLPEQAAAAHRTRPERQAAEPMWERVPAETEAQECKG